MLRCLYHPRDVVWARELSALAILGPEGPIEIDLYPLPEPVRAVDLAHMIAGVERVAVLWSPEAAQALGGVTPAPGQVLLVLLREAPRPGGWRCCRVAPGDGWPVVEWSLETDAWASVRQAIADWLAGREPAGGEGGPASAEGPVMGASLGEELRAAHAQLAPGWLAFDAPTRMRVRAASYVRALVWAEGAQQPVELRQDGTVLSQLSLGALLHLELRADLPEDFRITPLSPLEQALVGDENTAWEWIVTPRRAGPGQALHLTAWNLLDAGGRLIAKGLPAQTLTVDVSVEPVATSGRPALTAPLRVFISHASEDEAAARELETHMASQRRAGRLESWTSRVTGGAVRVDEITRRIDAADVVVLILSAAYMASEECQGLHVARAMARRNLADLRVIPVRWRSVDTTGASFASLEAVPTEGNPLAEWRHRDQAWCGVVAGLLTQE